jgi:hypothetical protein
MNLYVFFEKRSILDFARSHRVNSGFTELAIGYEHVWPSPVALHLPCVCMAYPFPAFCDYIGL